MRCWLVGLLALVLAGCDAPDHPDVSPQTKAVTAPGWTPATVERDRQRAEWLRLEHAGWAEPSATDEPAGDLQDDDIPSLPAPPALAIIIDDVGHGYAVGRRLIDMPFPLALAILPFTPAGNRLAEEALAAGKTVLLHLPMENAAGISPGPGGLYASMEPAAFRQSLEKTLDSLPGIQGVNNHMGSRLTTLRPQMDWVMEELAERQLFFVDSRTQAATQAAMAAEARGLANLSRDVFLDNARDPVSMEQAVRVAMDKARKQGFAVLIGHPYPETMAFLSSRMARLADSEGVQLVSLQQLLARHAGQALARVASEADR